MCLFCGSRYTTKVYQLDINKKEMRTLDVDVRAHLVSLAAVFLDVTQRSVRDIQKTAARETRAH